MPYIGQDLRDQLDSSLYNLNDKIANHPDYELQKNLVGLLALVYGHICARFIGAEVRYSKVNDVVGAIECCKLEAYRRLGSPYLEENPAVELVLSEDKDRVIRKAADLVVEAALVLDCFEGSRAGLLNYIMTEIFLPIYDAQYEFGMEHLVDIFNDTKWRIYEEIGAPYEDKKIKDNGDVYHVKSESDQ